jgi:hypothetical protein
VKETAMKRVQALLVLLLVVGLASADDEASRRERVKQRAMQRAYNKRIAKEWQAFTRQFVIRRSVPVYSGPYQVGWRIVETPNYPAIQAYHRQLNLMVWNSMTDQQKRDLALFTIARNTGIIAANSQAIARDTARIARQVDEIALRTRMEAIELLIEDIWPGP